MHCDECFEYILDAEEVECCDAVLHDFCLDDHYANACNLIPEGEEEDDD